jgi:hypothetical protein
VLFRLVLGIPVRRLVTDLFPAVACSVLMLGVANPMAELLRENHVAVFPLLAIVGIVGAWAYLAALYSLFEAVWDDLVQLARRVLPAPGAIFGLMRPQRPATVATGEGQS